MDFLTCPRSRSENPYERCPPFTLGKGASLVLKMKRQESEEQALLVSFPQFATLSSYSVLLHLSMAFYSSSNKNKKEHSDLIISSGFPFLMKAPMSYKTYIK